MSSVIKGLIPLALFAMIGVFMAIGLTRDPSKLPSELIDRPLPTFEMETLSGEPIVTADLLGEVALLNVFGSWCVACLTEHPLLMALSEAGDVKIMGVNWRDTRAKAERWLTRYGNPYGTIIFDAESLLAIDLGVTGAPETFVIDRKGQIRYKHTGPITEDVWTDILRPLIDTLNAETP
ncbi:thiol:disulfide interchange protein [Algimonas arctica]|uniref:Thiol:disulfide interchange protein n=1 Tax=Algimonas arctica TaxID=1479486 RepID=A0A8J3CUA5_9PROT|nr:DsbE family thiol:disulfide interchange protein [Algimonas arctica]GHB02615.1 thiol:disulfide interchange protein [Algimonas arctica]